MKKNIAIGFLTAGLLLTLSYATYWKVMANKQLELAVNQAKLCEEEKRMIEVNIQMAK